MIDLGRRRRHDPANRRHQTPHRRVDRRRSVRHRLNADHLDQFYLGACVGFSGANLLNTAPAWRSRVAFNRVVRNGKAGRTYLEHPDGIAGYSAATRRDPWPGEYPPDDSGSSALGLMQWWRELGVVSGFDWVISGGMDPLIASVQATPCLFGSYWFDDMMTTKAAVLTSDTDTAFDLADTGGHEYLCSGVIWRDNRWWFVCEQSWGEHPEAFAPTFYMRDDLVEHLIFGLAGDVAVPRLL